MHRKGAYILYLHLHRSLTLNVGRLLGSFFPAGLYLYVGSAYGGIDQRIARHRRLVARKAGKIHWHIDYLLLHPDVRLTRIRAMEKSRECEISKKVASRRGATIPVPHFGSTDCIAGCKAHLYRIHRTGLPDTAKQNAFRAGTHTGGPSRYRRT